MTMVRGSRIMLIVSLLPWIVSGTVHEGTYYLKNSDGVLPFTKITGPLCILAEYPGDVGTNLPHLEEVDSLCVDAASQVESIFLPELIKICHCLGVRGNEQVQEIRLPKLISAGEFNMQISTKLETLFVPELKEVGNVYITQTKLKQLAFPVLEQVGGKCRISANDQFEELHLPQLKTVGGVLEVKYNDALTQINISALEQVGADCKMENDHLEHLHLPNLKTVGGSIQVSCNTELNLSKLEEVGESIHVRDIPHLAKLYLPNLKTVGTFLQVYRNHELTAINLPKLEKVGERLVVYDIPNLAKLHLSNLKTVGKLLSVYRNAKLTEINLPKLEKVGKGIKIDDDEQLELELLYLPELKTLKHAGGSGRIFESNILDSKLTVMPKVPASEVQIFCSEVQSRRKKISQVDLKMKFEAFRIHQQARNASSFGTVVGMNWFKHFHKSQGKGLNLVTLFPKERRRDRRRNLLTMDKSVLRNIFLMLQPPMWHEKMAETLLLVEKYKHIVKENY